MSDETESLTNQLINLLNSNNDAKVLEIIQNSQNLGDIVMDIVPAICNYLLSDRIHASTQTTCEKVLIHVAQTCKPKETLIAFREQMAPIKNDAQMLCLLQPMQICLQALNGKIFRVSKEVRPFIKHISSLPLPDDHKLEGQEKLFLDNDFATNRITHVTQQFLNFLHPFVEATSWKRATTTTDELSQQRKAEALNLSLCLLNLLDKPLAYLDFNSHVIDNNSVSNSRVCGETIMALLAELQADYHRFVVEVADRMTAEAKLTEDEIEDDEPVSQLSLSIFAYLTFAEGLGLNNLPGLLTGQYYVLSCLPFVNELTSHKNSLVVYKGVKLLNSLLSRTLVSSLPADLLEHNDIIETVHCIVQALAMSQVQELTTKTGELLAVLMGRFTPFGRYKLLLMLLNITHHSGIIGYTIQLLKNEIASNLGKVPHDSAFAGKNLHLLFNMVFALPSGVKTDLVENCERIMASINLLRYLVIRDRPADNVTGIWNLMEKLKDGYCQTLHKAIDISRGHYKLEIDNISQGKKLDKDAQFEKSEFSIGGKVLAKPNRKEKVEALSIAVHRLDLMESLLCRFEELVEQRNVQS